MTAETVRKVLADRLDSPVEVGTYRGVDGVWAKVELDPRIDNSMRPTSLACDGTTVEEMKVRFVATTSERAEVMDALADLEAKTTPEGEVSAENHDLSEADELWPHILYEQLGLSTAAKCLQRIEQEPLPSY